MRTAIVDAQRLGADHIVISADAGDMAARQGGST
jgi:hypothetical protein